MSTPTPDPDQKSGLEPESEPDAPASTKYAPMPLWLYMFGRMTLLAYLGLALQLLFTTPWSLIGNDFSEASWTLRMVMGADCMIMVPLWGYHFVKHTHPRWISGLLILTSA
jgi:hypothetical protein